MIRYLQHNDIDFDKWDHCVNNAFNGNPYGMSWYLDLVHEDWEALVENNYERVMPLTGAKKFGISYLHQPFFAQQLGVFSTTMLNPEVVDHFIQAIPDQFRYIDIKLNSHNKTGIYNTKTFPNKNHILDLINEYAGISEKYSGQTRRNLKKAQKSSLSIMKNIKPESLIQLFRENRGKSIEKWGDIHYNRLQRLIYAALYKGKGLIYGVYSEHNDLCAGAFFLRSHDRLVFLFSGSDQLARSNGAMTFLVDHVIKEFTPTKLFLDFEGSNDPGLARFYQGFGARLLDYPGLRINRLKFPLKQAFSIYKRIKRE